MTENRTPDGRSSGRSHDDHGSSDRTSERSQTAADRLFDDRLANRPLADQPPEVRGGSDPPTPALPPEARDDHQPPIALSQSVRYGYQTPDGRVSVSSANAPGEHGPMDHRDARSGPPYNERSANGNAGRNGADIPDGPGNLDAIDGPYGPAGLTAADAPPVHGSPALRNGGAPEAVGDPGGGGNGASGGPGGPGRGGNPGGRGRNLPPDGRPPAAARNWGAALALVVLIGFVAWGVNQQRQLRLVQMRSENSYRRAFHQLIVHTEAIAENLDRITVSTGRPLQMYGLEEVRTQTSAANASFGALPVGVMPLQQTKGYIAHLNDWSRDMSLRLQEGESLTPEEYQELMVMRQQAHGLVRHLTDLRDLQAAGQLNWSSMEQFLGPAFSGEASGPLVDGITRLDSVFTTPRNESASPRVSPGSGEGLSGEPVDAATAEQAARRYISEKDGETLKLVGEVKGQIDSYRFDATAKDGRAVRVDVAKNGGRVTWMLADRPVGKPNLTEAEAIAAAERYLAERGYGDMAFSSYEDYGPSNVALITLVWRQGDVLVYPDTIRVRVALDDGEVLGVNAMPYLTFHRIREIPPAAISLASALTRVPTHLHVLDANPAIVEDERGNEVYTYEVRVQFDGDMYQIFYNANTGDEERVTRLGTS